MGSTEIGYLLLDYESMRDFLRDDVRCREPNLDLVRMWNAQGTAFERFTAHQLVALRVDEHQRIRKLVAPAFTPMAAGKHRQFETSFMSVGEVTVDGRLAYASKIDVPAQTCSISEAHSNLGAIGFESDHGECTIRLNTTNQGAPFALLPPCFESIGLPKGLQTRLFYHDWRLEAEWDGERGIGGWEPCVLSE